MTSRQPSGQPTTEALEGVAETQREDHDRIERLEQSITYLAGKVDPSLANEAATPDED